MANTQTSGNDVAAGCMGFVVIALIAAGLLWLLTSDNDDEDVTATGDSSLIEPISDALGTSNREAHPRVDVAQDGATILVTWAINENLTEGLTKDNARIEAIEVLEAIQNAGIDYDMVQLNGTFTLVDELGNESESDVVSATYPKSVIDDINFDGFDFKNAFTIVDSSVHPSFMY